MRPTGGAGVEGRYTGVFVALHEDLYNGDWVVHAGWKDLPIEEFVESAAEIGCDVQRG